MRDDPALDADAPLANLAGEAPAPEKKGELAALLHASEVAPDWLDGYLTGVVAAPQMVTPGEWLPLILDAVLPRIDPSRLQRFMDLLMMRARVASDLASAPGEFVASMTRRSKKGQADWIMGFAEATGRFPAAWPRKGATRGDRRLLQIVDDGLKAESPPEFAALMALRQRRTDG